MKHPILREEKVFTYDLKQELLMEYKDFLKEEQFIGYINDPIDFLKKNKDKYMFIDELGQVVLEASILGFPFLITSNKDDINFVTSDNFDNFQKNNFSKYYAYFEIKPSTDEELFQDLELIRNGNLEKFDIRDKIIENYDSEKVVGEYVRMLEGVLEKDKNVKI